MPEAFQCARRSELLNWKLRQTLVHYPACIKGGYVPSPNHRILVVHIWSVSPLVLSLYGSDNFVPHCEFGMSEGGMMRFPSLRWLSYSKREPVLLIAGHKFIKSMRILLEINDQSIIIYTLRNWKLYVACVRGLFTSLCQTMYVSSRSWTSIYPLVEYDGVTIAWLVDHRTHLISRKQFYREFSSLGFETVEYLWRKSTSQSIRQKGILKISRGTIYESWSTKFSGIAFCWGQESGRSAHLSHMSLLVPHKMLWPYGGEYPFLSICYQEYRIFTSKMHLAIRSSNYPYLPTNMLLSELR